MATYKQHVRRTERAHQDEIFKMKGREPTSYGVDTDMDGANPHHSEITSKTTHGTLTTSHDHKTGKITHEWDRSKVKPRIQKEGEMEIEDTDIDEALVSKATLARYRAKSKAKFREKGGISAALDKHPDEDRWKKMAALRKQGPEAVQAWRKRQGLNSEETLVDIVMTQEQPDASPYISEIEARCNAIVSETKALMQKSLFNFSSVDEARKPKPGSPGGSTVDRDVADRFKKQGKEKKQFASAKREIDRLKKKGK